jgi:polar amino acid transport system permease protein
MARSTARLGYHWQWYRIPRYLVDLRGGEAVIGRLLNGLAFSLQISGVSLVLAFAVGLVAAILRLLPSISGRFLARLYIEVIRGTPLLVQLYVIYFILGPILGLGRFASAVLALSLFEGAYASEVFRAGIVSIHRGQWEAAYSLGLGSADSYRFVILPQAVRRVLPPLASQAVSLVKDSALVSLVSLTDLTMEASMIASETFLTFEVWFTTAGLYLLVTLALSSVSRTLERRFEVRS